jgi:hypothetical protein
MHRITRRRWIASGLATALAVLVCVAAAWFAPASQAAEPAGAQMLAHNVYFKLNDQSDAAKAKLVAACQKYLKGHQGTAFFAAGTLAAEFDREVNDRDFDVALHIVFRSKADHDRYQVHERHEKFIAENNANWAKVRVFDSYVK